MVKIQLKPHQKPPVEFIKNKFGLLLYHSTGSGKTITSLEMMKQFKDKKLLIIGPKSSKKAFTDEINKLGMCLNDIEIYSYQKIKNIMYDNIDIFENKCVIVDEAHHLRNETKNNIFLLDLLLSCYKVVLLSATPVVNYLNDISPLINLIKQSEILPTDRKLFNYFYFDEEKIEILNQKELRKKIDRSLSFYSSKDENKFYPSYKIRYNKVEMNSCQVKAYIKYVKMIIFKNNPPNIPDLTHIDFEILSKREKNFFLQATRQISNTVDNDHNSPKIRKLYKKLSTGKFPAVVYSNFLKNGLYPIAKWLHNKKISYKIISGSTSPDKLIKTVDEYNQRKFKVLLISSAGSESLDLKNTRQIHIMEPHWNEAKIDQIIGRAIRYKSHFDLPFPDRNVKVYRWISIFPKPYINKSADEYLMDVSIKKREIFKEFKKILTSSSI